jgi:hypothetical protein
MTTLELKTLARQLARELHFSPSEIDRMTLYDVVWWLTDQE